MSFSGGVGSYTQICGGVVNYDQVGAGIARTDRWGPFDRTKYGVQGFRYAESATPQPRYGVRPFIGGETRWAGVEAGALFAELDNNSDRIVFEPSGRLRLGPADIAYLEAAVLAHEHGLQPILELGIGTAHWDFGTFHVGVCNEGFYFSPEIVTNSGLSLSPFVAVGGSNDWELSLRLQYNFRDFTLAPIGRKEY